ncbi:MAG TPA: hypothetical protein VGI48_02340 [Caldimonas sp.]|jgi:hypothetical protein
MLEYFSRAMGAEKAPYIVTLFVAAVAWTSTRTADRLSDTAFIEYDLSQSGTGTSDQRVEIRFRNITNSVVFPCFIVTMASPNPSTFALGPSDKWDQILRGTVLVQGTPRGAEKDEGEIELENFSPGADFALRIPTVGKGSPRLLVRGCSPLASDTHGANSKPEADKKGRPNAIADAPPILIPRSFTTFFVEWEIGILWGVLGIWLLALLEFLRIHTPARRARVRDTGYVRLDNEDGSID